MRYLMALTLLLASAVQASETTRINDKIITTGMTVAEVAARAGKPDRTVTLENGYGAAMAERWEYWQGRKLISLIVQGGKVVHIDEQ